MGLCLCKSSAVVEKDSTDCLTELLAFVPEIYTDCAYPSIISREGVLVATLLTEDSIGVDLTATTSATRNAAIHFSTILNFTGCTHLDISGENQIFSLWALYGGYMLVFFSRKGNASPSFVVGSPAANELLAKLIYDINSVLKSHHDD